MARKLNFLLANQHCYSCGYKFRAIFAANRECTCTSVFLHVLRAFKPALNLNIKNEYVDDTLDGDAIIVYDYGTLKKTLNSLMFRVSAQKRDEKGMKGDFEKKTKRDPK